MGRPKALLQWRGRPFIATVCDALRLVGVKEKIVVLGRAEREILAAWKPLGEKIAVNSRPEDGQLSSLRIGIEAAAKDTEGFMVCLVDQPTIAPQTYKKIVFFWSRHKDSIVIPRCKRNAAQSQVIDVNSKPATPNSKLLFKRGHPIIIPAIYRHFCFEGPLEAGLHWVTHHPSVKIADIEVNDSGIILDIDTPEQYEELRVRGLEG